MKLELKHLAPYLPYNLRQTLSLDLRQTELMQPCHLSDIEFYYHLNSRKPILRPISDLHKVIKILDDVFTPISILAELVGFKNTRIETMFDGSLLCCCSTKDSDVSFLYRHNSFMAGYVNHESNDWIEDINVEDQKLLFLKLFEWNFDIFGLIDAGLAVDINSL